MTWETSCGAVVFTRTDGGLRYVVAQEAGGAWSLPKGHMESGETELQTALREIREEVRLRVTVLEGFRATEEYVLREKPGVAKKVVYFCAEFAGQDIRPQEGELLTAALLPFEEALSLLTLESSRRVLREARDFLTGGSVGEGAYA